MDPEQFWQTDNQPASSPDPAEQYQEDQPEYESPEPANEPEREEESATVDYAARAKELEEQNRQLAARAQQVESTLGQVNHWAQNYAHQQEQQQEEQRYRSWESEALDLSRNMAREDAEKYIQAEFRKIQNERDRASNQRIQAAQQQAEQQVRAIARPQYVDQVVKDYGLDPSYRDSLATINDPNDLPAVAQMFKKQQEDQRALNEQIKQLNRSQAAGAFQKTGVGMGGGTSAPTGGGNNHYENSDDRAMAMLRALRAPR